MLKFILNVFCGLLEGNYDGLIGCLGDIFLCMCGVGRFILNVGSVSLWVVVLDSL